MHAYTRIDNINSLLNGQCSLQMSTAYFTHLQIFILLSGTYIRKMKKLSFDIYFLHIKLVECGFQLNYPDDTFQNWEKKKIPLKCGRDVKVESQPLFFSVSVRNEKLIQMEMVLPSFNHLSLKADLKLQVTVFYFVLFCNLRL